MKRKAAQAVSIIDGSDGPVSVFAVKREHIKKTDFVNHFRRRLYEHKRIRVERRIRAHPHSLKAVAAYAGRKYHAVEIPRTKKWYWDQYKDAKENLAYLHKPELFGSLADISCPETLDEESAKEMYRKFQLRSEIAAEIPDSDMPMDFHVYIIRVKNGHMEIKVDFQWGMFEVSYSGDQKAVEKLKKAARDLYVYYGVSREDIKNKTDRYLVLSAILSSSK